MKKLLTHIERYFEKMVSNAVKIYGHSVTFIIALCLVLFWLTRKEFFQQGLYDSLRDIIFAITFLSFFIIQKSVNRFSRALHLKINELVAAHEQASNRMVNIEEKTEEELKELEKHYTEISKKTDAGDTPQGSHSIEILENKNSTSEEQTDPA